MTRFVSTLTATLSLVTITSAALGQQAPAPTLKESPVANPSRVLFIGNSLVYYNGALQTHTHRMAAAATPLAESSGMGSSRCTSPAPHLHHYPIEFLVTPGNHGHQGAVRDRRARRQHRRRRCRTPIARGTGKKVIEFDAVDPEARRADRAALARPRS